MPYHRSIGYQRTQTSFEAADAIATVSGRLEGMVLAALDKRGAMTSRELAAYLDMPYASIQPRTSNLFEKGRIKEAGTKKEQSDPRTKPRNVTIWEIKRETTPCQLKLPLIN